jgi:drug/metabolite transporter superfamily protein YnfA
MCRLFIQSRAVGPTFTLDPNRVYPTIYGTEQFEFRPLLPPKVPEWEQERYIIHFWMEAMASKCSESVAVHDRLCYTVYQAVPTPLNWELIGRDIAAGGGKYIEPSRLPGKRIEFHNPDDWTEEEIECLGQFFREGQRRLLLGDPAAELTAFQWVESGGNNSFRKTIPNQSTLQYEDESAAYWASIEANPVAEDVYTTLEIADQGPLFNDACLEILNDLAKLDPNITEIASMLEMYYTMKPPPVSRDDGPLINVTLNHDYRLRRKPVIHSSSTEFQLQSTRSSSACAQLHFHDRLEILPTISTKSGH